MAGNDANTVLLLHMNGADQSTTFTDDGAGPNCPHTVTANGNAQIDTAQSKFGGASGLFDGNGDRLSTPDSADWYFGSGDFTIDFWVRFNAVPGVSALQTIYAQYTEVNNYVELRIENVGGTLTWGFLARVGGASPHISIQKASPGLSTNTWYHIALVRSGNSWYWFQAGTQCGTTATNSDAVDDIAGTVKIGTFVGIDPNRDVNGWLDEFRVSKGVARWTSNFTPPTEEYSEFEVQYIDLTDSGLGTEIITILDAEFINVSESGAGTEILGVEEWLTLTDTGLGSELVYLLGEILIDGIAVPHCQRIHISEPTIISSKPVSGLLPSRTYLGKQGRTLEIEGWVATVAELNTLTALADGTVHEIQLPTGSIVSVHIPDVNPIRLIDPGKYPYTIRAVERMD